MTIKKPKPEMESDDFPEFDNLLEVIQPKQKVLDYRMGGSAERWSAHGSNVYVPARAVIQAGSTRWTGAAATSGMVTVIYPRRYADGHSPLVFANAAFDYTAVFAIPRGDNEMLEINWYSADGTAYTAVIIHWLVMGPM